MQMPLWFCFLAATLGTYTSIDPAENATREKPSHSLWKCTLGCLTARNEIGNARSEVSIKEMK